MVYHITELIDRGDVKQRRRASNSGLDNLVASFEAGKELTYFGYWAVAYDAVKPFLLPPGHDATRFYGQFEAKARILEMLVRSAERYLDLEPERLTQLHLEIAACWMNSGRLQSANTNISQGMQILQKEHSGRRRRGGKGPPVEMNFVRFAHTIGINPTNADRARWKHIVDCVSVSATIQTRLGRVAYEILDQLAPFVAAAEPISDLGPVGVATREPDYSPLLEAGAITMLARFGELKMLSGDTERAHDAFAKAEATQLAARGKLLEGQSARRQSMLLARTRHNRGDGLAKAHAVVDADLAAMARAPNQNTRVSNDVIPY